MYRTRRRSVIEISNFSPLQNIAQRPRRKNLQKSCGKILTITIDKEARTAHQTYASSKILTPTIHAALK
nr:hypothetical protein [uncultured Campylobacter sp.]